MNGGSEYSLKHMTFTGSRGEGVSSCTQAFNHQGLCKCICGWFLGDTSEWSTLYSHMKSHHNADRNVCFSFSSLMFDPMKRRHVWRSTIGVPLVLSSQQQQEVLHLHHAVMGAVVRHDCQGAQNKSVIHHKCVFPAGGAPWILHTFNSNVAADFPLSLQVMQTQKSKQFF